MILSVNARTKTYQLALGTEFEKTGIEYFSNFKVPVFHDGVRVGNRFIEFLIEEMVPVEIVIDAEVDDKYIEQVRAYLKYYHFEKAFIVCFRKEIVTVKFISNHDYNRRME